MRNWLAPLALSLALPALAAAAETSDAALMKEAQELFEPIPLKPPVLKDNASTPAKVELGAVLYFDPRLSQSHNISCNTCHQIGLGGGDARSTSIGHKWQKGGRNAPTVLNAVFNTAQFWDGRAADLKEQAGGPIQNPIEMGITLQHAVEMLKGIPGYKPLFEAAFPGEKAPISIDNVEKAIAVFEATLITPNAPFDKYLRGDAKALTAEQKAGLRLFIDQGCSGCHNGINVGGGMYAPFGVVEKPGADILPPEDKGRFQVTKTPSDEYVFKVPSLRNIELTAPYFHTGNVWDVKQAVGVMGTAQLGAQLNKEQEDQIESFLKSLTGEQPQVVYPILPPSTALTPRPEL
ncbi:MAG: cytochrome-c peroxidase [Rhodospirillales bacterium]|nr:cytochrome-c peroxidase [Rhodospirillales bacterium]